MHDEPQPLFIPRFHHFGRREGGNRSSITRWRIVLLARKFELPEWIESDDESESGHSVRNWDDDFPAGCTTILAPLSIHPFLENKYLGENRLEGKSYYLSSRRTTRNVVDARRESTVELVCLVRFLVRLHLFGIAWRTDFEFIGAINIAGEKKGSTFSTISRNSTIDRSPRLFESVERFVSFSRSWNELDNEKIARTGIPTRISYFVILSSSNFHSIFSVDKIITSDWYSLVVTILLLRCKWLREKHHLIFNITRHIRFIDSFGICFRYLFIGRYIFARELYSTLIDLENHRFNWSNYLWTKYAREGWKKIDSKDKYNDECVVVSWSLSIETLNFGVGREWRTSGELFSRWPVFSLHIREFE